MPYVRHGTTIAKIGSSECMKIMLLKVHYIFTINLWFFQFLTKPFFLIATKKLIIFEKQTIPKPDCFQHYNCCVKIAHKAVT